MNRAQALTPLGFGCYEYRTDLCPPFSVLALELRRAHGMTSEHIATPDHALTHICAGPKPGDDDLPPPPTVLQKERLIDRVFDALKTAWRSNHEKLQERDICERIHASLTSKRVEKALRGLVREGLVQREGNNRCAVYWPTTTARTT